MTPAIVAQNLGKAYRFGGSRHWALRGVDLEIGSGESVGLVGRNGAGKSTLLRSICGTAKPTEGRVLTAGRVVGLLELGTGFNPEFTGLENVGLAAAAYGLSTPEIDARLADIQAFADLGELFHRPVKQYSSGMYARLAFAVAAHVDADILVVDELLAVGDTAFARKCMRWMRAFKQRGTLVFASHDLAAVISLCDRAIWIEGGRVAASGTPKDVCQAYLKSDTAQGARSIHAEQHPALGRRTTAAPAPLPDSRVTFGRFDSGAAWYGKHEFTVLDAVVRGADGRPISQARIGETVTLTVDVAAQVDSDELIVGFLITDDSGYYIFGQNTLATGSPTSVNAGERIRAVFEFALPTLHPGRYFVLLGVSEGTQETFVEQHWIERAFQIGVDAPRLPAGIVDLPAVSVA